MPVTLPPGRARLAIRPTPIGSATDTMTIGVVEVAAFAARLAGVVETSSTLGIAGEQLPGERWKALKFAFRETGLDGEALSFDISQIAHAAVECSKIWTLRCFGPARQKPYPGNMSSPAAARARERPRRHRAAGESDENAALHFELPLQVVESSTVTWAMSDQR